MKGVAFGKSEKSDNGFDAFFRIEKNFLVAEKKLFSVDLTFLVPPALQKHCKPYYFERVFCFRS